VPYGFANPHGRVFDYWGTDIITDATGNSNYFAPAFSGFLDYPQKHPGMKEFWNRPSRPCPGTARFSRAAIPRTDYNGSFLTATSSASGHLPRKVSEDGSGLKGETLENLLTSDDKNFRPTACSVAPDGSLYILDWIERDHRPHAAPVARSEPRPRSRPHYRMTFEAARC